MSSGIGAAAAMQNNSNGNGSYTPLMRRPKEERKKLVESLDLLDRRDGRLALRSAQDPIHVAFNLLDSQSVGQLAKDFVKDSFYEIANFISKVRK